MKLFKEPLLHFLLLGGLIFAFAAWRSHRSPPTQPHAAGQPRIEVSAGTIDGIRRQWERQYHRPPTADELRGMVDQYVAEQVLYREALALGLERDDSVVRRRLAQKMEFLSADIYQAAAPDDAELQRYFDQNAARYARPPRVSFRHVYFSRDRRGGRLTADVNAALAALGQPGTSDEQFGDPFVGEFEFADRTDTEVRDFFGREFAASLPDLPAGRWVGPVDSGYGVHLVRVTARGEPQPGRLADVRDAVARDYLEQRRKDANRGVLDQLRQRYDVRIDEAAITTPTPELLKEARVTP